jgi:hypothetical protein
MFPLHIIIVVKGFWKHALIVGSNIIDQYTLILTNNDTELTPHIFEFKCNRNNKKIFFV